MLNFSKKIRGLLRKNFDKKNKLKLKNKDFTLLCNNCTGGVIYNSLGLKFNSPTINEYMSAKDFIKFLNNLDYYLSLNPIYLSDDVKYPVAQLGDLTIYCVHYKTFNEFYEKWNERKKRVNKDNLFIIMTERDGCEYVDIVEFDKLPYENKVIFVHKEMPEISSSYYIPNTKEIVDGIVVTKPLTNYIGMFSGKRYIDLFDYVNFFNSRK